MSDSICIPVESALHAILLVATRQADRPDESELMRRIVERIEQRLQPPVDKILRHYIDLGAAQLRVEAADDTMPRALLERVQSEEEGVEDPLRREGLRWCVFIIAQGARVPPFPHLWFSRLAAQVLSDMFCEPAIDVKSLLADRRLTDDSVIGLGDGRVHMTRHLRLLMAMSAPGAMWVATRGLGDFGLPELEMHHFPADLMSAATLLLGASAQHLVEAATTATLGESNRADAVRPSTLTLPAQLVVDHPLIGRALGVPPSAEGHATLVRLEVDNTDPARPAHLRLCAPPDLAHLGDGWYRQAIDRLMPDPGEIQTIGPEDAAPSQPDLSAPVEARTLGALREGFAHCEGRRETLFVKLPFPQPGVPSLEFMWIVVRRWEAGTISGHLANTSAFNPAWVAGSPVDVEEGEAVAWHLTGCDGRDTGGPIGA